MKRVLPYLIISGVLFSNFGAAYALEAAKTVQEPQAPHVEKAVQDKLDILLGAIEDGSYAEFVSVADDNFKAALTSEIFQKVVTQVGPRLKVGYEMTYFGAYKQRGFDVYLWKLSFKDKTDDAVAELSVKDERVGGFYLR